MNSHDPGQPETRDPLIAKSRVLFERASQGLDVATANRLRLMRREALAGAPARPIRWMVPAVASAVLALGLAWWLPSGRAPAPDNTDPSGIASVVVAADDDAQTYAWLGEAPVAVDDAGGSAL